MKEMTTTGEVSNIMKMIFMGIQSTAYIIDDFIHMLLIVFFVFFGISYKAWFFETYGKIGEIRKRYMKVNPPIIGDCGEPVK